MPEDDADGEDEGWFSSACSASSAGLLLLQLLKVEPLRKLAHEPVLLALHHAALRGLLVVVAAQVEHCVDCVADHFALPARLELARLLHRVRDADEGFSAQPR